METSTPKKSVYIETTIPSYATSWRSRDVGVLNWQISTQLFWEYERRKYDLYVSKFVIEECARGNPEVAKRRLALIDGIAILPDNEKTAELAEIYFKILGIPKRAKTDCFHLAVCVCENIDYILSWNCDHIGMESYAKVYQYNVANGLHTPNFHTPDSLRLHEKEVADVIEDE